MLRHHRLGVFAIALASGLAAAELCGCSGCDDIETVASVDEPYRVEWRLGSDFQWFPTPGGGRQLPLPFGWIPVSEISLEPPGEEPFVIQAACAESQAETVELALAPEGSRLAYRCRADEAWTLYFLGSEGRRLAACGAATGPGALDWDQVPTLPQALEHIIPCTPSYDTLTLPTLYAELARLEPAAELAALARAASLKPASNFAWEPEPAPWDVAVDALDPAQRDALLTQLRAELARVDPPSPYLLWHVLRWTPKLDAAEAAKGVGWARALWPPWREERWGPAQGRANVLALLLERLGTEQRDAAAGLACELLAGEEASSEAQAGLLLAILRGRLACPAVAARLPWQSVEPATGWPNVPLCRAPSGKLALCSAAELAPLVERRLSRARLVNDAPFEPELLGFDFEGKLLLAAAYLAGPLPEWLLRFEKRLGYRLEAVDAPRCCEVESGPCQVDDFLEIAALLFDPEGATQYSDPCFVLAVDDAAGVLRVTADGE